MLEERALVIAVNEGSARVCTQRLSACDSCQLKSGCGTHSFAKLSGNQSIELEVDNVLDAEAGDVVMVAIPEQGLLVASFMMYLLPLVTMLASVVAAQWFFAAGEGILLLSAAIGLGVGVLCVRRYSGKHEHDARFTPHMTRMAMRAAEGGACRST